MSFKQKVIEFPDKSSKYDQSIPQPDFLLEKYNLVFEVKHLEIKKEDLEEEKRIQEEVKKNKSASYWKPERNTSFIESVKDTEKKFKNHPGKSSMLVYDISDYSIREPDIEKMLEGIMELKLNTASGSPKIISRNYKKRSFRLDKHREIGSVLFIRKVKNLLFHNIMAKNNRLLPLWMWQNKIGLFYCDQFVFVNIPNGNMLVQKLWP